MDRAVDEFVRILSELDEVAIRHAARELEAQRDTPDDDLVWWQTTLHVEHRLGADRRSVEAAMAARAAAEAVESAAERCGLAPDDADVVEVARRSRDVVRAAIAGPDTQHHLRYLLRGWWDVARAATVG